MKKLFLIFYIRKILSLFTLLVWLLENFNRIKILDGFHVWCAHCPLATTGLGSRLGLSRNWPYLASPPHGEVGMEDPPRPSHTISKGWRPLGGHTAQQEPQHQPLQDGGGEGKGFPNIAGPRNPGIELASTLGGNLPTPRRLPSWIGPPRWYLFH